MNETLSCKKQVIRHQKSDNGMNEILFKKVNGEKIENIVDYILNYIKNKSNVQICLGCDSQPNGRSLTYALTIVLYDNLKHNGLIMFLKE